MTGRILAPCVVLVFAVSALVPAQDLPSSESYIVRAEYTRWGANLTGHVQKGFGSAEGTLLDLVDDLGVGSRGTWQVKATARIGSNRGRGNGGRSMAPTSRSLANKRGPSY